MRTTAVNLVKDKAFITKHGLVLLYISQHPQCTSREMAEALNVTERTIRRVIVDLKKEGCGES